MIDTSEFVDLLGNASIGDGAGVADWFSPITEREILRTGYYANIYNAKIFVSKTIAPETIKVSNSDTPNVKDDTQWSADIDLNNNFPL